MARNPNVRYDKATAGRHTSRRQLLHARRLRADVSHNCSAKSNGPTVCQIRHENSLKRLFRIAVLSRPVKSTIDGADNRSVITSGPALERINEFHIVKINDNSGCLRLPCATTIGGSINCSPASDSPTY